MNLREFDYEFDLNGFVVLRQIVPKIKVLKQIKFYQVLKKNSKFTKWSLFWKGKNNNEAYISNILSADKVFEDLATIPKILKYVSHVTSNF